MKHFIVTIIIVTYSMPLLALQKQLSYVLPNKTMALPLAPYEVSLKNSLIKMRIYDPKKFFALKQEEQSNSDVYQSYINEVSELVGASQITKHNSKLSFYEQFMKNSKIDLAKKVAKFEMLKVIKNNWPVLETTIFNEEAAENWNLARYFTLRKLNEYLVFIPQHPNSKTHFLFLFGQNFILLDKATLKKVHLGLDINSRLDANTLPPDAANIKVDEDAALNSNKIEKNDREREKNQPTKSNSDENSSLPEVDALEIF